MIGTGFLAFGILFHCRTFVIVGGILLLPILLVLALLIGLPLFKRMFSKSDRNEHGQA